MRLLDEIIADTVNESTSVSNTLMKAKILAARIGLPELREWLDLELGGYETDSRIPTYRRFSAINFGTFRGDFHILRDVQIPVSVLPDVVKQMYEDLIIWESVGELEGLLAQDFQKPAQKPWKSEAVLLSQDSLNILQSGTLVTAHQVVAPSVISGVLAAAKSNLLDLVLRLQASDVTDEALDQRVVDPGVARSVFNSINVYGDHNIVASGDTVHQKATAVTEGDAESLLTHLREFGVDTDDLEELQTALSSEPDAPNGESGQKVRAWMGGMLMKAASGTWNVSLDVASRILTEALKNYYDS